MIPKSFTDLILKVLRTKSVELLLARLVLSSTGVQGWIVNFMVTHLFDKLAAPIVREIILKANKTFVRENSKEIIIEANKALHKQNADDYFDGLSRL